MRLIIPVIRIAARSSFKPLRPWQIWRRKRAWRGGPDFASAHPWSLCPKPILRGRPWNLVWISRLHIPVTIPIRRGGPAGNAIRACSEKKDSPSPESKILFRICAEQQRETLRDFLFGAGRRIAGGSALGIRAHYGVQSSLHLVRYTVYLVATRRRGVEYRSNHAARWGIRCLIRGGHR